MRVGSWAVSGQISPVFALEDEDEVLLLLPPDLELAERFRARSADLLRSPGFRFQGSGFMCGRVNFS